MKKLLYILILLPSLLNAQVAVRNDSIFTKNDTVIKLPDIYNGLVFWASSQNTPSKEGENVSLLLDRSGNVNNATQSDVSSQPELTDTWLYFDGSDKLEVENKDLDPYNEGFTINCWARLGTMSTTRFLFSKGGGGLVGWSIYLSLGNKAGCEFYDGNGTRNALISTLTINDDAWHMITAVHGDDDLTYLYIDGILNKTGTIKMELPINSSYNVLLGNFVFGSLYYIGSANEFSIYNRALSSTEILELNNSQKHKFE